MLPNQTAKIYLIKHYTLREGHYLQYKQKKDEVQ